MPGEPSSNDDFTYDLEPAAEPPREALRPIPHLDESGELNHEVRCAMCGYNLRGLDRHGHCPECGSAIWRSLQGNMLEFASPAYLTSLHCGVVLILIALIARVILIVLIMGAAFNAGMGNVNSLSTIEITASLVGLGLSIVALLGWWLFSAPDPAFVGTDRASRSRFVLRIAVVVMLITAALSTARDLIVIGSTTVALSHFGEAVDLITMVATAVSFFASLIYLRWLAPRFPDDELDKRARMYMWLLPIIFFVGLFACGIGPLITVILYYLLLNRVRLNLRYLRERQDQSADGAANAR